MMRGVTNIKSCTNSPEDGPVGPKHVEIQQYMNKTVTSVGFHSIRKIKKSCILLAVIWNYITDIWISSFYMCSAT